MNDNYGVSKNLMGLMIAVLKQSKNSYLSDLSTIINNTQQEKTKTQRQDSIIYLRLSPLRLSLRKSTVVADRQSENREDHLIPVIRQSL